MKKDIAEAELVEGLVCSTEDCAFVEFNIDSELTACPECGEELAWSDCVSQPAQANHEGCCVFCGDVVPAPISIHAHEQCITERTGAPEPSP